HEAAQGAGIQSEDRKLPSEISEDELLGVVAELNSDEAVDGILIQLPLPPHLDEARAIRAINPLKDVDGLHPFNAGLLYLGRPTLVPATPLGIMALLAEHRIPVEGADAVVIGRSDIVGKPIAHLLLQANATVTICHSRTVDRDGAAEHGQGGPLPPRPACVPKGVTLRFGRFKWRSAARCPGRRLFVVGRSC